MVIQQRPFDGLQFGVESSVTVTFVHEADSPTNAIVSALKAMLAQALTDIEAEKISYKDIP